MTAQPPVKILPCGDGALSVELADRIDEAVSERVIALSADLARAPIVGVEETVPTYRSLMVVYDPAKVRGAALAEEIRTRLGALDVEARHGRRFTIPVHYGGEVGLDLAELAAMKAMTPEALVELHAATEFRVYMIGFAPGFAYLGGLPEALHTPRLAVPRQRIEAGAIGIGGAQASINSVPGPSGWRYIGRTPVRLFDPAGPQPFLLKAGDRVRFRAVSEAEAEALDARVAAGEAVVRPEAP
ncbi:MULTISPECIES: 5-oxoprolinase subunit PxpB [unclassified Aureimonas]|uniref:5-oxoprolinase subunit PxpB n=1 Tax=unclassified Aureimonas TaxID=2615206 RepID=UPI0006F58F86|nr:MULTISPECIES: 5-oxoprolinase subunit PxpB [unclassified Aureimonas]KQT64499.1 allophanate hydrolase [Aureimonas sp. Leaf427]KQT81681.1 allophanate hydrolase [Aureimonas sp. Leaf460]